MIKLKHKIKTIGITLVLIVVLLCSSNIYSQLIWVGGNDTLFVADTTWSHQGEIFVVKNGVVIIKNAEFENYGNIWISNNGKVLVESGTEFQNGGNILLFDNGKFLADSSKVEFLSAYPWQFGFRGQDSSIVKIENSTFGFTLLFRLIPAIIGLYGNSQFSLINTYSYAWKSGLLFENSKAHVANCKGQTGEYWMMANATGAVNISNSENVGIWLSFPKGSVADLSTFYNEFVDHWEFPDGAGATGIPYSWTVDSSHIQRSSVLINPGSNVTVRDSYNLAARIAITGTDSMVISGFMDSTYHNDWMAPLPDRQFRLVNTTVETYSIYLYGTSYVSLDSSRVSEIVCNNQSYLFMSNSINNGKAGGFWIWDSSTVEVENSLITTQILIRNRSSLTLYNCDVEKHPSYGWLYGGIILENRANLFFLNSSIVREPKLKSESILFYASIDSPTVSPRTDSVAIFGSAYLKTGPDNNASFDSYQFYYAQSFEPDRLIPIGPEQTISVKNGLLGYWNTADLPIGNYILYLRLKNNEGDSAQTYWQIQIEEGLSINEKSGTRIGEFVLHQNYPNPFNPETVIEYQLPRAADVEISIFNLQGQKMTTLVQEYRSAGSHKIIWGGTDKYSQQVASGVYLYQLKIGKFTQVKKMMLLR
ncbi:MAG: hypothetical protein AMS23_10215 [Bacteroides sp. SM1_62]|nr:MAG: hypothetical protein AMS23_10215 [Bacteroides sp. SM1_62]